MSAEDPSSELEKRALTSLPEARRCGGEEERNTELCQLDFNANRCHAPEEEEHKVTRQQNLEKTEDKQRHRRMDRRREENTANESRNMQKETQAVTVRNDSDQHPNDSEGRCSSSDICQGIKLP